MEGKTDPRGGIVALSVTHLQSAAAAVPAADDSVGSWGLFGSPSV